MTLVTERQIFSEDEWLQLISELSLSPRQADVVKHLFYGQADKQIAMELGISVATLRTYLSRLFSKFDVQDRTELVLYVFHSFRDNCRTNGCPHY